MVSAIASASVSVSIFCAGLILGYVIHAWRIQRKLSDSSRQSVRSPPTSTFGHARRAF